MDLVGLGVRPKGVVARLRKQGKAVVMQDVYKVLKEAREKDLDGRSSAEAAIKLLDNLKDIYHTWLDSNNRLEGLLISTHCNAALTRQFGSVLMNDATYWTNKYKLPMLHIVALTGTRQTISGAFIWMPCKREEAYLAALRRFKDLVLYGREVVVKVVITDRD